jgi:hypothetical protein
MTTCMLAIAQAMPTLGEEREEKGREKYRL